MKTLKAKLTAFLLGTNLIIILMIGYFGISLYEEEKQNDLRTVLNHLAGEIVEEHLSAEYSIESLDYLLSVVHVKTLVKDSYISHPKFLIVKTISAIPKKENRMYAFKKLKNGEYFVLSSDLDLIKRSIAQLTTRFFLGIGSIVVLLSVIYLLYLRYLFRPLGYLVDYCESFSTHKPILKTPQFVHADYEIARVYHAITRLLKRIDNLRRQEKEIFKEAAHELKSPLAILKARLDLFSQQDDFDKKEFILQTNQDVADLTKIVKSLIFIKTVESEMQEQSSMLDIRGEIEELSAKFEPILKQKGQNITIMTQKTFLLERHKELFDKVMLVIFENSVIYGEKETPILIFIHPDTREIVITNTKSTVVSQEHFSSKIGLAMIKRLQPTLGYTYSISENETAFSLSLSFEERMPLSDQ